MSESSSHEDGMLLLLVVPKRAEAMAHRDILLASREVIIDDKPELLQPGLARQ